MDKYLLKDLVALALREDIGLGGDITSNAVIPANATARYHLVARQNLTVCGLDFAREALHQVDASAHFTAYCDDGTAVTAGTILAEISGAARALLLAERVMLNFMGHLSGIATTTARYVAAIDGSHARICETRKTLPGLRAAQKYAVRMGGGFNHRLRLDDAILIKDNHIAAIGGDVALAIHRARAAASHMVKISVEVDTLAQLAIALTAKPDIILLDNMSLDDLRAAVKLTQGKAILEASGGVTLQTVAAIAATGVDVISIGALTHSVINADIGLDWL